MPVSANTLFHFTGRVDNILSILQDEFRPHYCLENLNVLSPKGKSLTGLVFAIPMVCFCDIPLSQVGNHMSVYGHYAIGMRKRWGRTHRIAPVLYTYRESPVATALFELVSAINKLPSDQKDRIGFLDRFHEFACFIKPYEGTIVRKGKTHSKYRFYDEREWRYVARVSSSQYAYGMPRDDYDEESLRAQANASIPASTRIGFSPRDIKYVVVSKEIEIPWMIHQIETAKSRFTDDQVRLLVSRVISAQQIQEDF